MKLEDIRIGGPYWLISEDTPHYHGKKIVVTSISDYRNGPFPIRAEFAEPVEPDWKLDGLRLIPTEVSATPPVDWEARALAAEKILADVEALALKWKLYADDHITLEIPEPTMRWGAAADGVYEALGKPVDYSAVEVTDA